MTAMKNLRRTAADVKAEKSAQGEDRKGNSIDVYVPPEDDGARFELQHHHLTKMGLNGSLKSGDGVHFTGQGTVEKSETRSSPEGDRHSATIRFHKGAVDHDAKGEEAEGKKGLRSDLETAHDKATDKASMAKGGKQVPEKGAGK
jgi:hypothetical protein